MCDKGGRVGKVVEWVLRPERGGER